MMSDFIGLSEVLHEATMKNKYNDYNHNFTLLFLVFIPQLFLMIVKRSRAYV